MKILVTGGAGLLGMKCIEAGQKYFDVVGTYNKNFIETNCELYSLDITNKQDVLELTERIHPNVIIHTVALTNVDYCETHEQEAWRVNADGMGNIALAAKKINAKLIYVSTDYVFDGKKGMYKENDATNPINYYGKTKLEGENVVKDLRGYIIVRPLVLYGWNPVKQNFVTWTISELKEGNEIKIVKDQFNTPTLADNLAELIFELIEREESGIFHACGSERISRFDFALKIAEIFDLNKDLIKPITTDQLNWIAKRAMDSSLDTSTISGIKKPLNIEDSLIKMRDML